MRARTAYGTDAKIRRGVGWGGKTSYHPAARVAAAKWALKFGWGGADPVRRLEPYQAKGGATRFVKVKKTLGLRTVVEQTRVLPHQGTLECLRRKAGGTRALRFQMEG